MRRSITEPSPKKYSVFHLNICKAWRVIAVAGIKLRINYLADGVLPESACRAKTSLSSDYFKASIPGNFSPAKNSSIAPPPVETWSNLSNKPNFATAEIVSPPPTILKAA